MPGTRECLLVALRDHPFSSQGASAISLLIGVYTQPQADTKEYGASECDSSNDYWCHRTRAKSITSRVTRNNLRGRCHVDENVLFGVFFFFYLVQMNS